MKRPTVFVFSFILSFAFSMPLAAQSSLEIVCTGVFDSIEAENLPKKVFQRIVFKDDCVFAFAVSNGISVRLSIEKHVSKKDAHRSFVDSSKDFYGDIRAKTPFGVLDASKHWDELSLYLSEREYDTVLLMRKADFVFEIFCDDRDLLRNLEKIIREHFSQRKT